MSSCNLHLRKDDDDVLFILEPLMMQFSNFGSFVDAKLWIFAHLIVENSIIRTNYNFMMGQHCSA